MTIHLTLTAEQTHRLHEVSASLLTPEDYQEPENLDRIRKHVILAIFERGLVSVETATAPLRAPLAV